MFSTIRNYVVVLIVLFSVHGFATEKYLVNKPVEQTKSRRRWAETTLKHLSLEEKVGQMIQIRYFMVYQNFNGDSYKEVRDQLQKYHLGSITLTVHVDGQILLKDLPLEVAAVAN